MNARVIPGLVFCLTLVAALMVQAQGAGGKDVPSPWGDVVEADFPFFSSVLDARNLGNGWPTNNLTPRGLILNLGNDCWACFDVDLLRVSAIWQGKGVTPVSMSQGSYHVPGAKAPQGQGKLPQIAGTPWIASGIYPGWQIGQNISFSDPREPGFDPAEIGRGALPASLGRFKSIQLLGNGVALNYTAGGVPVREYLQSRIVNGALQVQRSFEIGARRSQLNLVLGARPDTVKPSLNIAQTDGVTLSRTNETWVIQVPPGNKMQFSVGLSLNADASTWPSQASQPRSRWPETVTTSGTLSESGDTFVMDNVELPTSNPWRRNVRFADIAFFKDGRAAAVTFDGDVWLIKGLAGDLKQVTWRRFTSGLHEPLGIAIRDDALFVFDRNGIWQLVDANGDGEADEHRLFSSVFAQTAETREFAAGMEIGPDGSFVIAKGGQQSDTIGKHNGTILKISPDGETVTVLGWGLRQPFMGVDPKTGLVTASDQQGHHIPSTPLHIIEGNQYYGFLPGIRPDETYPAPIADPLTWIPHAINASGAGQVWLRGAQMGPLNDRLIHIGYYRPELFVVLMHERASRPQAAVVGLTRDFLFAPLYGAVNPADGQLYVTGFQIWGTQARQISGLARLRYTGGASTLPREIVAMKEGVLLRFDLPLDPQQAVNLGNFSLERWNYKRTANYGSPHFKLDGSKGQETMFPSSVYLSKDHKAVFVGVPDMQPVMQMRFGWGLTTADGKSFQQNGYFTPYELVSFDPEREGFDAITVDLSVKSSGAVADATPVSAEEGKRIVEMMGCVACHSTDGSVLGKVGPTWKGLYGSERKLVQGQKVVADENYLRESILDPTAKVVAGFDKSDTGMPSYDGVISDAQIESIILYIKSLSSESSGR